MKWYTYRRQDGMEIRKTIWSPWLRLKGYRLVEIVTYKNHKKAG